nr:hypothetical protein [Kibdelosporangium sp. MJ126-NF4]
MVFAATVSRSDRTRLGDPGMLATRTQSGDFRIRCAVMRYSEWGIHLVTGQ